MQLSAAPERSAQPLPGRLVYLGVNIAAGQGSVSVVLVPGYTALAALGTRQEWHFIPSVPQELITVQQNIRGRGWSDWRAPNTEGGNVP